MGLARGRDNTPNGTNTHFIDGRLYLEDDDQDETGAEKAVEDILKTLHGEAGETPPVRFLRVIAVDPENRSEAGADLDRVGDVGLVEIYIFGVNRYGDLIGLKTFVVWT